jgi:hypothetical protein
MRDGGFSYDLIHHALHVLGSRALGFSQELFDPSGGASDEETAADHAERGSDRTVSPSARWPDPASRSCAWISVYRAAR